jgi:hypothetical protein
LFQVIYSRRGIVSFALIKNCESPVSSLAIKYNGCSLFPQGLFEIIFRQIPMRDRDLLVVGRIAGILF